jgi:peptidoglycan hydrolase-like protein with peptidoglycan-binding domain
MLWLAGIALPATAILSTAQTSSTPATSATSSNVSSTSAKTSTKKTQTATRKSHHKRRPRGQQKMDAQRVQAIQEALVREHYLSKPTGKWDATTQAALQKYQAANGWQSKVVPDSRALIKLGLGPSNDHLLNPESAMTSTAPATHTQDPPTDPKQ